VLFREQSSLRFDPIWDEIRSDPRFQKLIKDGDAAKPKP
jgi:hypothetical protein